MPSIKIQSIHKSFGELKAVDGVSFDVQEGEIFGLLGPNGAGKTTLIRIMLDIFKPDSGEVIILGGEMTEAKKNIIGYMPEERGLYQDITLERCLVYLGTLKGLSASETKERLRPYLERFDLAAHKDKKVKELSKGMQQKAQLIATLQHEPELIIIDEPFAGLDPVNTRMVKELLQDLRHQGVTIMMSTHQMHQVEELCDRIALINRGERILYGDLADIRSRFSGHAVWVQSPADLPPLPGVEHVEDGRHGSQKLTLSAEVSPQQLLASLVEQNIPLERFEIATPTLDEIFIQVVQNDEGEEK